MLWGSVKNFTPTCKTIRGVFKYMPMDFLKVNVHALTWPIKYKHTITLLNQLRDEDHHIITVVIQEGVDVSASGYGELFFIPHNKLDLQEEKQCHTMSMSPS